MKPLIIATVLAVTGFVIAPILTFAAQPLNLAVSFSPNPPRQGMEIVTVLVTDGTHKPVNGAHVSVASRMPTMSMTGPTVAASPKGNGRYVATLKIAFATRWAFTATAKSNGKTVSRTITQEVK